MALQELLPDQQALARRCLAFLVESSALDDEFGTRLGASRGEVASLLMHWPAVADAPDSVIAAAISNALNEVAHGLSLSREDWARLGSTPAQVTEVLKAYATSQGWRSTGIR